MRSTSISVCFDRSERSIAGGGSWIANFPATVAAAAWNAWNILHPFHPFSSFFNFLFISFYGPLKSLEGHYWIFLALLLTPVVNVLIRPSINVLRRTVLFMMPVLAGVAAYLERHLVMTVCRDTLNIFDFPWIYQLFRLGLNREQHAHAGTCASNSHCLASCIVRDAPPPQELAAEATGRRSQIHCVRAEFQDFRWFAGAENDITTWQPLAGSRGYHGCLCLGRSWRTCCHVSWRSNSTNVAVRH